MNKEQLLGLGLSEEQAVAVMEGFKGYVPPSRFNEVNEAKKSAEAQIVERDKQLAGLKKEVGDNEDLKKQIEALQTENKESKAKYEAEVKRIQIENAVDRELTASGARNLKAVKALLNLENAEMEGDSIKGLADQIKALQGDENSKFMFKEATPNTPPTGAKAGESTGGNAGGGKSVAEMNYSERVAYLEAGGKL